MKKYSKLEPDYVTCNDCGQVDKVYHTGKLIEPYLCIECAKKEHKRRNEKK